MEKNSISQKMLLHDAVNTFHPRVTAEMDGNTATVNLYFIDSDLVESLHKDTQAVLNELLNVFIDRIPWFMKSFEKVCEKLLNENLYDYQIQCLLQHNLDEMVQLYEVEHNVDLKAMFIVTVFQGFGSQREPFIEYYKPIEKHAHKCNKRKCHKESRPVFGTRIEGESKSRHDASRRCEKVKRTGPVFGSTKIVDLSEPTERDRPVFGTRLVGEQRAQQKDFRRHENVDRLKRG